MRRFFKSAAFPILLVVILAFVAQKVISPGDDVEAPSYNDLIAPKTGLIAQGRIEEVKPWELQKQARTDELKAFLDDMVRGIRNIAHWVAPFLPGTSAKLLATFDGKVERGDALFPRLP